MVEGFLTIDKFFCCIKIFFWRFSVWLWKYPPQMGRPTHRPPLFRVVGKILSMSQWYGEYPCHQVVNHIRRTVLGWFEQPELLCQEGVLLKENGCVEVSVERLERFHGIVNCLGSVNGPQQRGRACYKLL